MPLYLLPNVFADDQPTHLLLPEGLNSLVATLDGLIAESERTGRRYLMKLLEKAPLARQMPIYLLNEHSKQDDYKALSDLISSGKTFGLISDAGMPGIADPGSRLVKLLRKMGCSQIRAIPGPSSVILALISSGLVSTPFTFHGYAPKEPDQRKKLLKRIEREEGTHIFIEAPYRNRVLFSDCLATLSPSTRLCLAANMTLKDEWVLVRTIQAWKTAPQPEIHKVPIVFLIQPLFG